MLTLRQVSGPKKAAPLEAECEGAYTQFWKNDHTACMGYGSLCGLSVEKGKVLATHGTLPCYAYLDRIPQVNLVTALSFSLRHDGSTEIGRDMWNYFLSSSSPWQLPSVEVFEEKDVPVAFRVSNLQGVDTRVLAGLAIASRIPWEHKGTMLVYKAVREKGLSPFESLFAAINWAFNVYHDSLLRTGGDGHHAFDRSLPQDFHRIRDSKPNLPEARPFLSGFSYLGVSKIFNAKGQVDKRDLLEKECQPERVPYVGQFRKYFERNNPYINTKAVLRQDPNNLVFPTENTIPVERFLEVYPALLEKWHNEKP